MTGAKDGTHSLGDDVKVVNTKGSNHPVLAFMPGCVVLDETFMLLSVPREVLHPQPPSTVDAGR